LVGEKKRWFRDGQKWRTGCEGRISVIKRRNGLNRCRYKADDGMQRWVALGVISDNLVNMGGEPLRKAPASDRGFQTPLATPDGVRSCRIPLTKGPEASISRWGVD
jgi:hypothetical protein